MLIAKAEAADTPEGAQDYARYLTARFVAMRTEDAYVGTLSRRLATADLMTRQGKRNWIPENIVAQAFNDEMKEVVGPSGKPPQTDVSVVHQLRLVLYGISPHFSS